MHKKLNINANITIIMNNEQQINVWPMIKNNHDSVSTSSQECVSK